MISGKCSTANRLVRKGARAGSPQVEGFHDACRGRFYDGLDKPSTVCDCLCHEAQVVPTMQEAVAKARRDRMIAAGIDPDAPARGRGDRQFCRHEHEMTTDNTGPRGECRTCKRESSQRCKARRANREEEKV